MKLPKKYFEYLRKRNKNKGFNDSLHSYSQSGQDIWVIDYFNRKRKGFFLEIGAGDGIYISNTLLLEREFEWTGILIEPSEAFKLLVKNRPSVICDNSCVASENKTVTFLEYFDVGQARLNDSAKDNILLSKVKKDYDISEAWKIRSGRRIFRSRCLKKTVSLVDLLRKYKAPHVIDYFSLDVEGYEWEILKKFPFNEYKFLCLGVEKPEIKLRHLLENNGYGLREILGDDLMYVNI